MKQQSSPGLRLLKCRHWPTGMRCPPLKAICVLVGFQRRGSMSHGQFEFLLIFKIFMIPLHIYLGFNKTYVIFAIKKKKKKKKKGRRTSSSNIMRKPRNTYGTQYASSDTTVASVQPLGPDCEFESQLCSFSCGTLASFLLETPCVSLSAFVGPGMTIEPASQGSCEKKRDNTNQNSTCRITRAQ